MAMPLFENRETQNMNRSLHSRIDVVKNLNCVYDKFGLSVLRKVKLPALKDEAFGEQAGENLKNLKGGKGR